MGGGPHCVETNQRSSGYNDTCTALLGFFYQPHIAHQRAARARHKDLTRRDCGTRNIDESGCRGCFDDDIRVS